MRARTILVTLVVAVSSASLGTAGATDAPHDSANGVDCIACHTGHNAAGLGLTVVEGNANLCLSCHQVSQAVIPAFLDGEQADLKARRGFHHRWDSGVSGHAEPSVTTGGSTGVLRSGHAPGGYTGDGPKTYTITIDVSGTASSATFSWTGTGSAGGIGAAACGTDVPLNEGVVLTCLEDAAGAVGPCGAAFCAGDAWTVEVADVAGLPSHAELANRLFDDKVSCSTCHDQHSQANASYTSRTVGPELWRHFMRISNGAGELCAECHRDRFPDPTDPNHPFDLTRTWTGTPRSHPVAVALGASGKGYDRVVPLDADGTPQSTGDGISSNDLVLGPGGQVTCLTCHGVHGGAADGNGQTE